METEMSIFASSSFCILAFQLFSFGALQTGVVAESYNISVDIATLGRLFSPGSIETGFHRNLQNVTWFLYVTDPANLELFIYPKHVDLETCCDRVTITTVSSYADSTGTDPVVYTGSNQVAGADPVAVAKLVGLPTIHSTTGMVKIHFTSDDSVALSGFAFRYFALHKLRVVPSAFASLPAFSDIKQFAVQAHVPMFTIRLSEPSERIWLQVIHMNLSTYNPTQFTLSCRDQIERITIYDTHCTMNDCHLGIICRHSYSITPITLVSAGHVVSINSTCAQPGSTDCAIINYKINDPTTGMGTCGAGDVRGYNHRLISDFWVLEHSWNAYSPPSALDRTWWIQNTNPVGEMLIWVMENQLSSGPDCASERIEIYSGDCITPDNLVTYFCGEVKDSYKLTASRIAAIRFIGNPSVVQYGNMRFSLWIFAGTTDVITPNPNPYGNPYGQDPILITLPSRGSNGWNDYVGLWITLIILSVLASIVSAAIKYRMRKKMQAKIQHGMPMEKWLEPLYTGWEGPGVPPPATYDPPHSLQPGV